MAGRGRMVTFHGAFNSKADAQRKERARPGSFIKSVRFRKRCADGRRACLQTRYLVMRAR